jgi:hypothetical protein
MKLIFSNRSDKLLYLLAITGCVMSVLDVVRRGNENRVGRPSYCNIIVRSSIVALPMSLYTERRRYTKNDTIEALSFDTYLATYAKCINLCSIDYIIKESNPKEISRKETRWRSPNIHCCRSLALYQSIPCEACYTCIIDRVKDLGQGKAITFISHIYRLNHPAPSTLITKSLTAPYIPLSPSIPTEYPRSLKNSLHLL